MGVFRTHMCVSSLTLYYALPPLSGVSHLLCTEGCSIDCNELTNNRYATVPIHWLGPMDADELYFGFTLLISEICWAIVIWIVKSSILVFYWRLFSARSRSLRVIIWALGAFVTCWGIALVSPRPSKFKLVTTGNFESRW